MTDGFTFADAFAGIGGFHAALSELGGSCVWACENDPAAAAIYWNNWGVEAFRDITVEAPAEGTVTVDEHQVFAAGFPCQPFSKSGRQQGMEEARGTLFYNIARILEQVQPALVVLENVRNLSGPRHTHEWDVIITTLRQLGYRVSARPAVMSPHLLPPQLGGGPQVRDRVFITATYVGDRPDRQRLVDEDLPPLVQRRPVAGWDPSRWCIEDWLAPRGTAEERRLQRDYALTDEEKLVIAVWNDFLKNVATAEKLPGFPLWADEFQPRPADGFDESLPPWKLDFLEKNADFYVRHRRPIDAWKRRWQGLEVIPPSRRKLEWQAGSLNRNLYDCLLQFRPSGIRAKPPTYLPAFVAINQTSIVGPRRRRVSPAEAARVQGLPIGFTFGDQADALSYKQVGNGVHVGVVKYVLQKHVERDRDLLPDNIVEAIATPTTETDLSETLAG